MKMRDMMMPMYVLSGGRPAARTATPKIRSMTSRRQPHASHASAHKCAVHPSRLVWKFEAQPIAAQPRLDLLHPHLTAIAFQIQLGPIGQIAASPASPTFATEVEESHPPMTARADEPWPAPPELRPRLAEIYGLLDRLTTLQNAEVARRLEAGSRKS
jgi:hypothetical protein